MCVLTLFGQQPNMLQLHVWWNYASAAKMCKCWYVGILLLMTVCFWWTNHANGAMQHQTNILKLIGTQRHKHKHRHRNKHTLTHTHTNKSFRGDLFSKFSISRVGEVTLPLKGSLYHISTVSCICCSNLAKIIFVEGMCVLNFCIPFTLMLSGWYFKHVGFPLHQPWDCFDPLDSKFLSLALTILYI